MTGHAVSNVLAKRQAEAGVAKLPPYDFRRTSVGDLLDAGADLRTVQQSAGHASVTTTARYDRSSEAAKRKAGERMYRCGRVRRAREVAVVTTPPARRRYTRLRGRCRLGRCHSCGRRSLDYSLGAFVLGTIRG